MNNKWPWILIPILFFAALASWWWYGRLHPAPIEQIPPNQPGMTLMGTSLAGWEQGKKVWEVNAERIWRSKDGLITVFEKISGGKVFTDEEIVYFEAPFARMDQIHQMMTVQGGIQGRLKDGEFSTQSVKIDLLQKKMASDSKFNFRYNDLYITANKIQSDLNQEILLLEGNVHLRDGQQSFEGKALEYDLNAKTYQLSGETKAEMNL